MNVCVLNGAEQLCMSILKNSIIIMHLRAHRETVYSHICMCMACQKLPMKRGLEVVMLTTITSGINIFFPTFSGHLAAQLLLDED